MSIASEINRIKTNISNAYTEAENKGATLPQNQNSDNLADTISSIQTGGGTPVSVEEKDVNFYDYDGTRLYSYTLTEVQNLTELPALPSHTGLTCQGWNWTLADIKAEGKETDVGAMYITDDGKTRLHIKIDTEYRTTIELCFRQSVANGVEVDWGDGSAIETFSDSGNTNILPSHTYANLGEYIITLNPLNNCQLSLGGGANSYNVLGSSSDTMSRNSLQKVHLGSNVILLKYGFNQCYSLQIITLPNYVNLNNTYIFNNCQSINNIIVPTGTTEITSNVFYNNFNLCDVVLPGTLLKIQDANFNGDRVLIKINLPNNIITLWESIFANCIYISKLVLPKKLGQLGRYAFSGCTNMKMYDFSNCLQIPTLSIADAFNNIPSDCKIVVPDSLYTSWIGATNWSTYASYIMKKSDWEASQV